MEHAGPLEAAVALGQSPEAGELGHPALILLDRVRDILVASGLPPEPDIYELLYLHVSGADAGLSHEVDHLLQAGELTSGAILALRKTYLGDIAATELLELVEAAQAGAMALAAQLDRSHAELGSYDAKIREEEQALSMIRSAQELAELVQRLRRANTGVMHTNRQLEADVHTMRFEMERLIERLEAAERNARTDPLTGLLNRRGLIEALKRLQHQAAKVAEPLSAAMVDVDHFKRVNDQWGHATGDEVLRCVGSHLHEHARNLGGEGSFAGRYGGEEFVVALRGMDLSAATAAVDQVRAALARKILRRLDDGVTLGRVTISAGVATNRKTDSGETLIDRADAALFAAKRAGRDRVLPESPE